MNEPGSAATEEKIPLELQRRPDEEYIQEIGAQIEAEERAGATGNLIMGFGLLLVLAACALIWLGRVRRREER